MLLRFQQLIISSCIIFLTACGGGSGDSTSSASKAATSVSVSSLTIASSSLLSTPASSMQSSIVTSAIASVASSTSSVTLLAPQNLSVKPGNATVTLTWNAVSGAASYHIYYATESNIQSKSINTFQNGTWVQNVSSPHVINSLENNKTYYFVVTAVNGTTESLQSIEVSATPSAADSAKQPNAQEVLVMELINRARFDPAAEATRFGIGLNDGISGTQISTARKPPLASNLFLVDAARVHTQWMLDNNTFSHDGANGNSPTDRMRTAGYVFTGSWSNGENIAWAGTSGSTLDLTQYAINHHEGLFKSAGHRQNILNAGFREVGVGQKKGNFKTDDGTIWLSSMLTEDFASSGSSYFLSGVIYNDANGNQFYDVGEGLDGVTVTINGKSYPVFSTGAYSIPLSNGTYDVTITGAPLGNPVLHSVQINNANIKLNVIKSGASATVVSW